MTPPSAIAALLLSILNFSILASADKYPIGAWLLDDVFRGLNLGSGGQSLGMSTDGLKWSSEGPRPFPHLKYAHFKGSQKTKVQVLHNDSSLFDFWKPFSIALWLKTDNATRWEGLFEGWNSKSRKSSGSLAFSPSPHLDQLVLHGKHRVTTTRYGASKLMWRHIAVIFDGADKYSFYLNGTAWPISGKQFRSKGVITDVIEIGAPGSWFTFRGCMACLLIFQRALSQEEVQRWMRDCP